MNHLCFSTPILFRQSNQYDCGFAVILFVLEFSRAFNDVKFHEKMFVHCIDGNVFQNVHVENIWALDMKYYNSFGETWLDPDTKIPCDTVMQGMRWDCLRFIDNMTIMCHGISLFLRMNNKMKLPTYSAEETAEPTRLYETIKCSTNLGLPEMEWKEYNNLGSIYMDTKVHLYPNLPYIVSKFK